ncbi:MAG: hypothetical protein HXX19_16225, partial [Rhodoferax sp.]|nr:hypothetical protein [Rhodoferax sp.]
MQGITRSAVLQSLRPHWHSLLLLLALQILQTLATLLLPYLSAEVVDLGVSRGDRAYVTHM